MIKVGRREEGLAALTDLIWEKCFLRVRVCNLPRNALTLRSCPSLSTHTGLTRHLSLEHLGGATARGLLPRSPAVAAPPELARCSSACACSSPSCSCCACRRWAATRRSQRCGCGHSCAPAHRLARSTRPLAAVFALPASGPRSASRNQSPALFCEAPALLIREARFCFLRPP